jgi:CheY-like chemotaxis protein
MATSGEQALRVCAEHQPDLVPLDVEMPTMDGYQVCARLKADAATRDIPVIFVTAHRDELSEDRESFLVEVKNGQQVVQEVLPALGGSKSGAK